MQIGKNNKERPHNIIRKCLYDSALGPTCY